MKERYELRDLNFQLKCHINALKASMYSMKDTFILYSQRAENTKKSNTELHSDWMNYNTNFQPHRLSIVKVNTLIWKEQDTIKWDGKMWKEFNEARVIRTLNPDEPF